MRPFYFNSQLVIVFVHKLRALDKKFITRYTTPQMFVFDYTELKGKT